MQHGVPQGISSSYGTVYFNDLEGGSGLGLPAGNGILLQSILGGDYPTIRNPVDNRPQKDGGIVHPFFKGAKFIEMNGLLVSSTSIYRQTLTDHLLGVTDRMLGENGSYFWTPSGAAQRTHTVRLYESVEISPDTTTEGGATAGLKRVRIVLVAARTDVEDDY